MTWLPRLRSWFRACFRRADLERSMSDEMAFHIELYEADLRRLGVPAAEARRRAHAEFGSVEARKDECREAVGLRLMNEFRSDVVYACRLLRRSPAFTVVALLSVGLGIGANTAIFSLVDSVLVKSLPVADPQRLFFVDNSGGTSGGRSGPPYPCFEILRDNNRFLSGIAAFHAARLKVTLDGGAAEQMRGQYASGNYFDLLGVRAVHGRVFTPADDSVFGRGGPNGGTAVISYALWKRRFGMDPAVVGKNIQVGANWVTIVGVTPPEFFGLQVGSPVDITLPIMLAGPHLQSRTMWWMSVVARLKPEAAPEQAQADLEALWDAYMTDIGQPRGKREYFTGVVLVPAERGLNDLRRAYSEPLLILMAIVAVVLLIGCANLANLLLARASARQNEMAVRLAIGAGRARLIRQLLTEGAVLVTVGTLVGLVVARWMLALLLGVFGSQEHGILLEPQFDGRVLGFTVAIAALTAILFSLAPALHATRFDAARPASAGLTSSPRGRTRLGQSLVVLQVTLAVVLLCAAALFLRTMHNLNRLDTGFDRAGVLTMVVEATIPTRQLARGEQRAAFAQAGSIWEQFIQRVRALPGVTSAAVSFMSPLTGRDRGAVIALTGMTVPREHRSIHINEVTAEHFQTMGIPLVTGRLFTASDRGSSARVAILNRTAAATYFFGSANAIGRKLSFPGQPLEDEYEIVGVVGDARYQNVRTPDERMVYLPIEQPTYPMSSAAVALRGSGDLTTLVPAIRTIAAQALPGGFVTRVGTIDERLRQSLVRERVLSSLATFFGGLALALACIGVYGVMAYCVVRRTREIGIRIAIGARQRSVIWMIARETLALVALGTALGTIIAFAVGGYVETQLFGVAPDDPLAITAAILLLLAFAAAAGYLPARRASRIDPVIALRCES